MQVNIIVKVFSRSLGLGQKNLFLFKMLTIGQQNTVAMSHYLEHGNGLVLSHYHPGLFIVSEQKG